MLAVGTVIALSKRGSLIVFELPKRGHQESCSADVLTLAVSLLLLGDLTPLSA